MGDPWGIGGLIKVPNKQMGKKKTTEKSVQKSAKSVKNQNLFD